MCAYRFEREQRAAFTFYNFRLVYNQESLLRYDRYAADAIHRAEGLIQTIQEYRRDLQAYAQELECRPYRLELRLDRQRSWNDKKVFYILQLLRVYDEDGQRVELSETYPGTQRRQAIQRFETLKRERPGISATLNIQKAAWER